MKNHTNDRFEELLLALAHEKSKTKNLEQRLMEIQSKQATLEQLPLTDQQTSSTKTTVSTEMLDQFKQLLKAFKHRQEEEKAAIEERERLANELKTTQTKLLQTQRIPQNSIEAETLLRTNETLLAENQAFKEREQAIKAQLNHLQEELSRAYEENGAFQGQIRTMKTLLTSLKSEIKIQEDKINLPDKIESAKTVKTDSSEEHPQLEQQSSQSQSEVESQIKLRHSLDKMSLLIKEKDKRITELCQFEYSAKKAIELKLQSEGALGKAQQQLALFEKEKSHQDHLLEESRQHAKQLERVVEVLRDKSKESHLETEQLQRELQAAQYSYEEIQQQYDLIKSSQAALDQHLKEEMNQKQDLVNENQALQAQFEILMATTRELKQKLNLQSADLDEANAGLQVNATEKQQLAISLEAKTSAFITLEAEIAEIKQNLVRGLCEAKELESQYLQAVKEKVAAVTQYRQLQKTIDNQQIEIEKTKQHSKELSERLKSHQEEFRQQYSSLQNIHNDLQSLLAARNIDNEQLKQRLGEFEGKYTTALTDLEKSNAKNQQTQSDLKNHETNLKEKESFIKELLDRLMRLEEDRNAALDELSSCRQALDEKELLFDEAQKHLAKKVREVALLDNKLEELNERIQDSITTQQKVEDANSELNTILQKTLDEKAAIEEKVNLSISDLEQWQAKHARMEARWQEAMREIQNLQTISIRHQQLQEMVSNFSSVLSKPLDPSKPSEQPPKTPQIEPQMDSPTKELGMKNTDEKTREDSTGPDLFNKNNGSKKPKRDLFE